MTILAVNVATDITINVKLYPLLSIKAPTAEVEIAPTKFPTIVTTPNPIALSSEGRLLVVDEYMMGEKL